MMQLKGKMVRRSKRLQKRGNVRKKRDNLMRNEWLQKRGRMIFLDRIESRSSSWFEGENEDSDYWTKQDVIEVRTLMQGHLGNKGEEINAVFVGLDKETKNKIKRKNQRRSSRIRAKDGDKQIEDSGMSGLKVFGWVQKNKESRGDGDVEWRYAGHAEGDEDETTIDMTDALVQEKHPEVVIGLQQRPHRIRPKDKVPLEIVCVAYERAK
jgi:hypothetical protein